MVAESLVTRYKQLFQKLLPPGVAMNRRDDSALADWLESFAIEFARVDDDALAAFVESYPGDATSAQLLSDWEALVGLPNSCTSQLTSEADRRAAVLANIAASSTGQSEADFRSLATDIGVSAFNVSLYETSRCGVMRCGHTPLHSDPWLFASRMSYESAASGVSEGGWLYHSSRINSPQDTEVLFDETVGPITEMRIDNDSSTTGDQSAMLAALEEGDEITWTWYGPTQWISLIVNGAVEDEGDWYRIPMKLPSSSRAQIAAYFAE